MMLASASAVVQDEANVEISAGSASTTSSGLPAEKRKSWDAFLGAASSALVTKTVCAPFDRIRLLLQLEGMFHGQALQRESFQKGKVYQPGMVSELPPVLKTGKASIDDYGLSFRSYAPSSGALTSKTGIFNLVRQILYFPLTLKFSSVYSSIRDGMFSTLLKGPCVVPLPIFKNSPVDKHSNTPVNKPHFKYYGLYQTAKKIVDEEGVLALWRGNGVNLVRAVAVYTLKFGTNDSLKSFFSNKASLAGPANTHMQSRKTLSDGPTLGKPNERNFNSLKFHEILSAAAGAGLIQKTACFPLDLMSVRISLGVNVKSLGATRYDSFYDCFMRIWKGEGFLGFYKGGTISIGTGVTYVTAQMTLYEIYKRRVNEAYDGISENFTTLKRSSSLETFMRSGLAGCMATLTAQAIVYPADTVRKRMMSNGLDGKSSLYRNSLDCLKKIYSREGGTKYVSYFYES